MALGYNVMAIDTDVLVLDDWYWRVKQPPLNTYNMLSQAESSGFINGGFSYIQVGARARTREIRPVLALNRQVADPGPPAFHWCYPPLPPAVYCHHHPFPERVLTGPSGLDAVRGHAPSR